MLDRAAFMKETELILKLAKEGLDFRKSRLDNIRPSLWFTSTLFERRNAWFTGCFFNMAA